ncbi:MAG: anthranilate synthase component I [Burkholderiales bacterium]|nr:anthranilate synthase component I [Burkholderiales bacterium]
MTQQEFNALAGQGYNRIPVTLETLADLDTPLSVYLKLANQPFTYLFESVVGGERFGRYSIVGLAARTVLRVRGREITVEVDGKITESTASNDPLAFIEAFQGRIKAAPAADNLRFSGGLTGYFGYDTVRYIEPKLAGTQNLDTLGVPDILLMLTEELAVVDNLSGKLHLIVYADPAAPGAYDAARDRLADLRAQLASPASAPSFAQCTSTSEPLSEFPEEKFLAAVAKAKRYIVDGDIMQVQISQRIRQPFAAPPINLYRALRSINPSPYMFYLDLGDFHIVGASPEILVRLEDDLVTLRPIAGTRRRGADPAEDKALEEELLNDPKERAEHLMLIDLGRNDVGRVAQIGSVRVTERMVVERYSHVMHLVSNVEGKIKPEISAIGLLRASFPAGTVTGTPKVRAMEIIDELETVKRGIYAGAVGYLGFNGNMDVAIAIRTAIIKDETLYVQAAAGIVADSVPKSEWEETRSKARGVLRAAEMVLTGFDAQ